MSDYGRRGGKRWQPPQPKPFDFVRIHRGDVPRQRPAGHDRYQDGLVRGTLTGVITALTPVHVASGQMELTGRHDLPLMKAHVRAGGRPVIPGSSLKGAIRSIVEAISRSCLRITRARWNQQPRALRACRPVDVHGHPDRQRLCVACRMFGAMGYQGQVRFSDAVQRENETEITTVPSFYPPRPRERVYFDQEGVRGRKFFYHGEQAPGNVPIEACPAGSNFDFSVHFENLTAGELGLLLIVLGQGDLSEGERPAQKPYPKLHPKLGGGKPACLGTIDIALGELLVSDQKLAWSDYDAGLTTETPAPYLAAAGALVLDSQLKDLANILEWPSTRRCPDRNY